MNIIIRNNNNKSIDRDSEDEDVEIFNIRSYKCFSYNFGHIHTSSNHKCLMAEKSRGGPNLLLLLKVP